ISAVVAGQLGYSFRRDDDIQARDHEVFKDVVAWKFPVCLRRENSVFRCGGGRKDGRGAHRRNDRFSPGAKRRLWQLNCGSMRRVENLRGPINPGADEETYNEKAAD